MFDLINGLPLHPLVVHAVVVLVPLAALGTIAIVARPAWRSRFGVLVVAAAAMGTILTPISTSSGEALEKHVGDPGEHAALGDQLIWFMIPLLVLALAVVLLHRRRLGAADVSGTTVRRSGTDSPTVFKVVAALAVVAAIATTVQVYRIGDSGAREAWGDQVSSSSGGDSGS